MKKTILIIIGLFILVTSMIAQDKDYLEPNTIMVKGESVVQLAPNEIIISIRYEEYYSDGGTQKTDIETIERQLMKALKTAGIKDQHITQSAVQLTRTYDRSKRKYEKNRLYKTINVCVFNAEEIANLINVLERASLFDKEITNFRISDMRHTDMEKYKEQAKVEAIKDAKAKAELLLSTLGKKVGDISKIREITNKYLWNRPTDDGMSFYGIPQGNENSGISPISITYELEAVFKIN